MVSDMGQWGHLTQNSGRRAIAAVSAIAALGCLIGACSSPQTSTAASPPPKDAAKISVPIHVDLDGASADVTLTGITFSATTPDGTPALAGEYAILHLTFVGKSAQPFKINISDFVYQYTQQPDPYQPEDSNLTGVDPTDWSAFPQRLPDTSVSKGKEVSGTIPLDMSPKSLVLISLMNNDATPVAQWLATSG
jgi:hypothetical protein